jgi:DNA-binding response OmpR family regulator
MVSTPLLRRSLGVRVMTLPVSPSIARSLLVSSDPATIEQITEAMERLAVATDVCVDVAGALRILSSRKFDAVMVDFDLGDEASGVLGEMRQSPSNRTAPTMAIIRNKSELAQAYCAGSNFVLERPLSPQSLERTLSAGYGLIVRERRRYFRCRVRTRVALRRIDMRPAQSHTVNISEGGMEVTAAPAKLEPGTRVHVEFTLPDRMGKLTGACEVVWRNKRGHVGLRFRLMPLEQRCDLQEWLAEQLEKTLPEEVAERFRQANDHFRLD